MLKLPLRMYPDTPCVATLLQHLRFFLLAGSVAALDGKSHQTEMALAFGRAAASQAGHDRLRAFIGKAPGLELVKLHLNPSQMIGICHIY